MNEAFSTLWSFRRMRLDARLAGAKPVSYEITPTDLFALRVEDAARLRVTVEDYDLKFGPVFTHLFGLPVLQTTTGKSHLNATK